MQVATSAPVRTVTGANNSFAVAVQSRLQGNDLTQAGQFAKALQKYHEALNQSPQRMHHKIYANMAMLYLSQGDAQASCKAAETALQLAPPSYTQVRLL